MKYINFVFASILFLLSGIASVYSIFVFGIIGMAFPVLPGVLFAIAWLLMLHVITYSLGYKSQIFIVIMSTFGMFCAYTAANSMHAVEPFNTYDSNSTVISTTADRFNSPYLGLASLIGAAFAMMPLVAFKSKYRIWYYAIGLVIAFAVGWFNAYFPDKPDGSWSPHYLFNFYYLFISWQVVMGSYLIWVYNRERVLQVPKPPVLNNKIIS